VGKQYELLADTTENVLSLQVLSPVLENPLNLRGNRCLLPSIPVPRKSSFLSRCAIIEFNHDDTKNNFAPARSDRRTIKHPGGEINRVQSSFLAKHKGLSPLVTNKVSIVVRLEAGCLIYTQPVACSSEGCARLLLSPILCSLMDSVNLAYMRW